MGTEAAPCKEVAKEWPSESHIERPEKKPNMLASWSWTSINNCEGKKSFLLLKPSGLLNFVCPSKWICAAPAIVSVALCKVCLSPTTRHLSLSHKPFSQPIIHSPLLKIHQTRPICILYKVMISKMPQLTYSISGRQRMETEALSQAYSCLLYLFFLIQPRNTQHNSIH